jgi:demethylmenaquinone methyltransferase / 2-methoxy-6-polyprenyl-1,4-benzoquinol methylase
VSERPALNLPEETVRSRDPDSVREMFSRISPRYDLANHILSAGCDFFWRKRAAEIVTRWRPSCVLDLATGSGDLALALQRKLPRAEITAADFSAEMIALARGKGVRRTIVADALNLPFAGQSFDVVTVAFGLRNMRDWAAALGEMRRVLTGSGHLLVLEFSLPRHCAVRAAYRFYLHQVLPCLCTILTGNRSAYEYLGASIENFPRGRVMGDLINANGFTDASAKPLTGGIVTLYTAASADRTPPPMEVASQSHLAPG